MEEFQHQSWSEKASTPGSKGSQVEEVSNSMAVSTVKGRVTQGRGCSHTSLVVVLSQGHQKQDEHLYSYHVQVCNRNPFPSHLGMWHVSTFSLCTYPRPRLHQGTKQGLLTPGHCSLHEIPTTESGPMWVLESNVSNNLEC